MGVIFAAAMRMLYGPLIIAKAIGDRLHETTSAVEAAALLVEILAVQSKAVVISIRLPGEVASKPICERGFGGGWTRTLAGIELEACEKDEIVWRDGSTLLATVRCFYHGIADSDPDRENDRALAEYMLSLVGPRIKAELRRMAQLSGAELKVAGCLHLSNYEIGERLCISRETVRVHIKNIYRKLGVSTREEVIAVLKAREEG